MLLLVVVALRAGPAGSYPLALWRQFKLEATLRFQRGMTPSCSLADTAKGLLVAAVAGPAAWRPPMLLADGRARAVLVDLGLGACGRYSTWRC